MICITHVVHISILINDMLSISSACVCVSVLNLTQKGALSVSSVLPLLLSQRDALGISIRCLSEFPLASAPALRPVYMFRVYLCFCPHPNIKRHLLSVFCVSAVTMHNIIIFSESYKVDHFLEVSLTPGNLVNC